MESEFSLNRIVINTFKLLEKYKKRLEVLHCGELLIHQEAFFIRARPEHARGGADQIFDILIEEDSNFYCSMDLLRFGTEKSLKFYFTGLLPAHLLPFLKAMNEYFSLEPLKNKKHAYSSFDSFTGNFDIRFRCTSTVTEHYIDYNAIDFYSQKARSKTCLVKQKLLRFQMDLLTWLESLSSSYQELLQKGVFGIEIQYE